MTMRLGFRYEAQTNIGDWHDLAPRAGIAWALAPKTVARAGFGIFYDRFGLANTMTALRRNGIRQQQYILTNPDFFLSPPSVSSLAGFQSMQVREQVSPTLVAPTFYQSMISIERQLPRNTTMAVTFANSHGLHVLRSRDVNAPLPGTYDPAVPGSGVYPLGPVGAVFLMESSGLYNQRQLIVNVNSRANKNFSLTGVVQPEPCHEQYGWSRYISSESIQHCGGIRAGVNRCPSPHEPRWIDQHEVERIVQSARKRGVRAAIRYHRRPGYLRNDIVQWKARNCSGSEQAWCHSDCLRPA